MGRRTFSRTLRQGSSAGVWKSMPTSRLGPLTGTPPIATEPLVGGISPAMIRSSVDFPQPERPTSVTNSCRRTSSVISASASTG